MKRITIIGTGYVGLVSGAGLSDFGHQVVCADIDEDKIALLQSGTIPIYEPGLKELVARNEEKGRLTFTTDVGPAVKEADVVFIAVGTPPAENGMADLSAVKSVARLIGENLDGYKVICTKSTVPVGTGQMVREIIEENQTTDGEFDYCSNPEFLREGSAVGDFLRPDRVILGATSERAFAYLRDVYRPLYINETPIIHTTVETAEMIKYASNAFLALKISYINEIANLCEAVGADVHVVAKAMGIDGRISPKFLHPGPGFGGSCFPKDTRALVTQASKSGVEIRTIEAAIESNQAQKERMVMKLRSLLGDGLEGKTIALLGLAFKPETDDVRESPAVEMIKQLQQAGAQVRGYDPAAGDTIRQVFPSLPVFPSWEAAVEQAHAAVIMTEWNEFRGMDLARLKTLLRQPVVLDCRNILNLEELKRLGFRYDNVGRKARRP
ncbi:MAG: UDP-glucose dehydrogenase family protein [Fidelibacterota bacterium]